MKTLINPHRLSELRAWNLDLEAGAWSLEFGARSLELGAGTWKLQPRAFGAWSWSQTDRQTDHARSMEPDRQTDRQTDRPDQTDRQTNRDRQTDNQTTPNSENCGFEAQFDCPNPQCSEFGVQFRIDILPNAQFCGFAAHAQG